MAAKRDTSNSGIYDKLESLRLEVKRDISSAVNAVAVSQGRLEAKFDKLEAGRLTAVEGKANRLELAIQRLMDSTDSAEKTLSNKFVALGSIGIVLLTAISSAFFFWLFNKGFK